MAWGGVGNIRACLAKLLGDFARLQYIILPYLLFVVEAVNSFLRKKFLVISRKSIHFETS